MQWVLSSLSRRDRPLSSRTEATADEVRSANAFATDLFGRLSTGEKDVFVSPVSVSAVLGMILSGATPGGLVEREMRTVVQGQGGSHPLARVVASAFTSSRDENMLAILANSAWLTVDVLPAFRSDVSASFKAEVRKLPSGPGPINDWVKEATSGMIPSLLDSMKPNTVALLVNAVYFKAAWTCGFDTALTEDKPFYTADAPVGLHVKMMTKRAAKFRYGEVQLGKTRGRLRIVEIPYGDDSEYAAVIALPSGGATMADAVARVQDWETWMNALGAKAKSFDMLALPRFKLDYGAQSLKPVLSAMGLHSAWSASDPGSTNRIGKFARMSSDPDLHISDVIHAAAIEVNEAGTTAAAASAAIMTSRSLPVDVPVRMTVNSPFLFAIHNTRSGLVLFLGRIDNPLSS
jgi:serine protease inhibitor